MVFAGFKFHGFAEIEGMYDSFLVAGRCYGEVNTFVDGRRKYESVVVIGMLANDVDATGCRKEAEIAPKEFTEVFAYLYVLHKMPVYQKTV